MHLLPTCWRWLLSCVWLFACQAPPSMEFPRHDYWSGAIPFSRGPSHPVKLNPCLIHSRWFLYHLRHQRSPISWLRLMLSSRNEHCDHLGTYSISEAFLYQGIMRERVSKREGGREGGRVCAVYMSRERIASESAEELLWNYARILRSPQGTKNEKVKRNKKAFLETYALIFQRKLEAQKSASHLPSDTQLTWWQPRWKGLKWFSDYSEPFSPPELYISPSVSEARFQIYQKKFYHQL